MNTTIINKTPHPLTLVTENGNITIEPTLPPVRVTESVHTIGTLTMNGVPVPVTRKSYGEVENLPDPADNTVYVVSALVAARVPERLDVLITSSPVRDESGRIIGCRELAHI